MEGGICGGKMEVADLMIGKGKIVAGTPSRWRGMLVTRETLAIRCRGAWESVGVISKWEEVKICLWVGGL